MTTKLNSPGVAGYRERRERHGFTRTGAPLDAVLGIRKE
jgi:hypothetical protein